MLEDEREITFTIIFKFNYIHLLAKMHFAYYASPLQHFINGMGRKNSKTPLGFGVNREMKPANKVRRANLVKGRDDDDDDDDDEDDDGG